jgi:hypothetical protein
MAEKPATAEPDKNLSAKRLGRIGATLCGIVIFAILATTIWAFSIRPGNVGDAMGVGMLMVLFIPAASIPAFLVCLVGAAVSANALREHPGPEARSGLRLSVVAPITMLTCYGASFALIQCFGH